MANTQGAWWWLAVLVGCVHATIDFEPNGCFIDSGPTGSNQPGRQMRHQVCEGTGVCATLTRADCADACRTAGFKLYGVEAGHQCYCDNEIKYPQKTASPSDCNITCTGAHSDAGGCWPAAARCPKCAMAASSDLCGGRFRLWVDVVASIPPPPPTSGPCPAMPSVQPRESRNIVNGTVIFASGYLDQPYCQVNEKTGDWTCITTAGPVHEGGNSEHMVSQVSSDRGRTWTAPAYIEPPTIAANRDNSYGTLGISDAGRLYAMYNMNLDNITHLPDGKPCTRTDELGHFVMRYSDDGGRTWSADRYEVPYRETPVDFHNSFNGKVKTMWCVDQVKQAPNDWTIYSFTKIGNYVQNAPQEVWFLASSNLRTEKDASKVTWQLLPNGDHGILPPGVTEGPPDDPVGDVLEEGHIVPLAMGGFYVVGRTTQGYLAATHTNASIEDGLPADTFAPTGYANYYSQAAAASGALTALPTTKPIRAVGAPGYGVKNPRGPITPKRMANGQYLLLFYNNAGNGYAGQRDPYWLAAGLEAPGHGILWSQPEIVLYDRYSHSREAGGYPDFIQDPHDLSIHIVETQKNTTRIHKVLDGMLAGLFGQFNASTLAPGYDATLSPHSPAPLAAGSFAAIGEWSHEGQGFTLDLILPKGTFGLAPSTVIVEATDGVARVALVVGANNSVVLELTDVNNHTAAPGSCPIETDPLCSAVLRDSTSPHSVAVVVDAGPMVATWVVDGLLCDGGHSGAEWTAGWFWLPPLGSFGNPSTMVAGQAVGSGYVYSNALPTSALVSNHRSRMQ